MTRLEYIQNIMDHCIAESPATDKRYFYVHLYGVAHFSALLAVKRGLNPELASIAGMLHDVYAVKTENYENHAEKGAEIARQILIDANTYTQDEINIITEAVRHHSDKENVTQPYDRVLQDADIIQPYLYD